MKRFCLIVLIGLLVSPLLAKGLDVGPPSYDWTVQALGRRVEMPVPVTITNRSTVSRWYVVQAQRPEEGTPLPDLGWVSFDRTSVMVQPGTTAKIRVFLNIPAKKRLHAQAWMFYLAVKEKPPPGDRFALVCYPKITVRTGNK
jgi:hypothetical protein